jgi:hypothetical protein
VCYGTTYPAQGPTKLWSTPTRLDSVFTRKKLMYHYCVLFSCVVIVNHLYQWWFYCPHWKTRIQTIHVVSGRNKSRCDISLPSTISTVFIKQSQSTTLLPKGECKDIFLSFETKCFKVLKFVNFARRVYLHFSYDFRNKQ